MKKGTFRIKKKTVNGGWIWEEREGFYGEVFGIFKEGEVGYSVTHLKTGLRLSLFDYLRQARHFVKRIEEIEDWPVPWNSSTNGKDYVPNADRALAIRDESRML